MVNLSLFNNQKIDEIRYWSAPVALEDWSTVVIKGPDAFDWFQRQLAQDIKTIELEGLSIARLDRSAKIKYFGILYQNQDNFFLYLPTNLVSSFMDDFEKFVIMEDIKIVSTDHGNKTLLIGKAPNGHPVNFFGEQATIVEKSSDDSRCDQYFELAGVPIWNQNINGEVLVNETRLNDVAVDYTKGCFLGQETAAKIQSRRGANYFPVFLESKERVEASRDDLISIEAQKIGSVLSVTQLDQTTLIAARIKRDYRVIDSKYEIMLRDIQFEVKVLSVPYFKDLLNSEKAKTLYVAAVKDFEKNNEELALKKLKRVIEFDPSFSDAYEVIGVIYSRAGKHELTIEWMDKLLEQNSKSVMAHTNKSLALMNLGKIEEAEMEKSLATTKSFAMYGEQAKSKKEQQAKEEKELQEMTRREEMFRQVLAIDENDQIALFGLADISFKRKNIEDALSHVEKSLLANSKHSQSYLLKGKCLEEMNNIQEAIKTYQNGVRIAASAGELMPANEMQSRINKLSI